jgi:hypothetical protein
MQSSHRLRPAMALVRALLAPTASGDGAGERFCAQLPPSPHFSGACRKNRDLSMSKNDDERIGFYNLSCVEVIFKIVNQIHPWGEERIKKIVASLVVEGIKIFISVDIWYSYSYVCSYFLQYTFQDTFQQYTLVKSVTVCTQ